MDYFNKHRVKWFGHFMKLPIEQPALRAYRAGSSGTRAKSRLRKRWIDDMEAVFKNSMGLYMFGTTQVAETGQLFLPATPFMGTKR